MEIPTTSYQLTQKIKDKKFNVDDLQHYNLSIVVFDEGLQILIVNSVDNQCLIFEDFTFTSKPSSSEDLITILQELFDAHHLLTAGFWNQIKICVINKEFTLIPSNLFQQENALDFLSLNSEFNITNESIEHHESYMSGITVVYALNRSLKNWLEELYPNSSISFFHQANAWIEYALRQNINSSISTIIVEFTQNNQMSILLKRDGQIELFNIFSLKNESDAIRYIMITIEQLNLNQEETNIVLWGNINASDSFFIELSRYIKNVSTGVKPDFLNFGYMFDELEENKALTLLSTHLCN